ncbi:sulfotransferase 1C2-like isoform X1 [Haemaphysalis longicornis]
MNGKRMTAARPKPYYQVVDGVPRSPLIAPELLREGFEFVPEKGDLLQVSYPKSGTHWVQYITQLILRNGEPLESYEDFRKNAVFLEYRPGPRSYRPSNVLRTFLTHIPLHTENMNPEAKYVYVARNPWDCCVSAYHYAKDVSVYLFEDGTFDDFFECFLEGDFGWGDYFEHVVGGYSLKNEPNVFFVTYEELKTNTRNTIVNLARFIGDRYGNMLENDGKDGQKLIDIIIERSAPGSMRNILASNLGGQGNAEADESLKKLDISSKVAHGGSKSHSFVRRGEVGGWKEYFSPDQLRRMESKIAKKTHGSNVMSLWSDIREEALRICGESE